MFSLRTASRGVLATTLSSVVLLSFGCEREGDAHARDAGTASGPASKQASSLAPIELPPQAFEAMRAAFVDIDKVRALLAADTLDGMPSLAASIEKRLVRAGKASGRDDVGRALQAGSAAAVALGDAKDIAAARHAFSSLNEALFAVATADSRLQEGWRSFECPMVDEFPKWFQRGAALENPYMGKRMLTCGSASSWGTASAATTAAPADANDVAYWTCSMHPSVKQSAPGKCPICGMDLTPVTRQELESGVVLVDDVRRQKIGVRTARVELGTLDADIRAVGRVTYDETRLFDVTLKVAGYVEKLFVEKPGQRVSAGQPVLLLQSPELFAAQGELLVSRRAGEGVAAGLADASYARFELWGIAKEDIAEVEKSGVAKASLPIRASKGGTVVEKNVVEGQRVDAGTRVLRIAALDHVWIEAEVYEGDLPRIKVGDAAQVTLPYVAGKTFQGKVGFVYPYLESSTRTGRVRIELPNVDQELKPDMFADVVIAKPGEPALRVPKSAVIFTGERRLVFVDLGEGRLKPVEVKIGRSSATSYEVLDGLKAGDVVVTSGNFLVAAESRLKSAQSYWSEEPAVDGGTP